MMITKMNIDDDDDDDAMANVFSPLVIVYSCDDC